jgi:hypothetical protein
MTQSVHNHYETCYYVWYQIEDGSLKPQNVKTFDLLEVTKEQARVEQQVLSTNSASMMLDEKTARLLALSGTWEDTRTVEEIIQDIYESRTIGKEDFTL